MPLILEALKTPDSQWISPPFGEQFWIEMAVGMGLKLNLGTQGWYWYNRTPPEPVREAARGVDRDVGDCGDSVRHALRRAAAGAGREYAVVDEGGSRTVCVARATAVDIDVQCNAPRPGTLTVRENSWAGWYAYVDGQPAPLKASRWLTVDLPPGSHTVELRYRPWDVPLGAILGLAGGTLAIYLWRRQEPVGADVAVPV